MLLNLFIKILNIFRNKNVSSLLKKGKGLHVEIKEITMGFASTKKQDSKVVLKCADKC
jgi:hypothetical protein